MENDKGRRRGTLWGGTHVLVTVYARQWDGGMGWRCKIEVGEWYSHCILASMLSRVTSFVMDGCTDAWVLSILCYSM
jgi:hypothetical protein